MGHEIAGGVLFEKRRIHFQDMAEYAIAYCLFQESGKTDDQIAPDEAQDNHQDGDEHNGCGNTEETIGVHAPGFEGVDGVFDKPWNNKLKKVDKDKCSQPAHELQSVATKGWQQEIAKLCKRNALAADICLCAGGIDIQSCSSVIIGKKGEGGFLK
jgi:hypothetical protein